MLTYDEALQIILKHAKPLDSREVSLNQCLNRVLSRNVYAPFAFPSFDNSAVDGFAIKFGEKLETKFRFKGEVPAGHLFKDRLNSGEAVAIFTGAPVPRGAEAVVMQECAQRENGHVVIQKPVQAGDNIRLSGEDFKKGDLLIEKGTCLEPQHVALLASIGIEKVSVIRTPRVAILATGNELVKPGEKLSAGKIYDSNTPLLQALLSNLEANVIVLKKASDDVKALRKVIQTGLDCDVLIVSGGVSVGKYDFVKTVLLEKGVSEIFWKVNIKPGKPLFFGKKEKTLVFGLPGNPVSVFVTFWEFVRPAILKMKGKNPEVLRAEGILTKSFRNGTRPHFIRVVAQNTRNGYRITPLEGQGSHQVSTLARANALLKIEPNQTLKLNERVSIELFAGDQS